jgi:hypothetical protein
MTAKDKLRQVVEELTELEAEQMLELITRRREHDPVLELFNNAPVVDEPLTDEERASLDEARAEYERGETVPLDEFMRELD